MALLNILELGLVGLRLITLITYHTNTFQGSQFKKKKSYTLSVD